MRYFFRETLYFWTFGVKFMGKMILIVGLQLTFDIFSLFRWAEGQKLVENVMKPYITRISHR